MHRAASGDAYLRFLPEDTDFLPLHGNPEFEAIVAEVNKRIREE